MTSPPSSMDTFDDLTDSASLLNCSATAGQLVEKLCEVSKVKNFTEWTTALKKFDWSVCCGLVWTPNFVAYRCRTCARSQCMSLCAECFLSGSHANHDFNMFRSQAGGACDCGDANVMFETGFCPRHGAAAMQNRSNPPVSLTEPLRALVACASFRLIRYFREAFNALIDGPPQTPAALSDRTGSIAHLCEAWVATLQQIIDAGGAGARAVFAEVLTNKQVYKTLNEGTPETSEPKKLLLADSHRMYRIARRSLASECPDEALAADADTTQDTLDNIFTRQLLKHTTLVDELTFWLVRLYYPQNVVTFLLSLLPEENYRMGFATAFARHYGNTVALLPDAHDEVAAEGTDDNAAARNPLANRIIHISVQLFSNDALSIYLVREEHLLRIMVGSLRSLMERVLRINSMHSANCRARVVDCGHPLMTHHNYWALVSDIQNVLSHTSIAVSALRDPFVLDTWVNGILAIFQGMNVNVMQTGSHIEYETRDHYTAFTAEIEICSTILWSLVLACRDSQTSDCILGALQMLSNSLSDWFENLNFRPPSCFQPPPSQLTFHLPLHRYYAAFLSQALRTKCNILYPGESLLRQMLMHPLQIQVGRAEIACGMWIRNGQSLRYQSVLYGQRQFCSGLFDLDVFLMQVGAARLQPDWFVLTVLQRFHLVSHLSFHPSAGPSMPYVRKEWTGPLLEACLWNLAVLLSSRIDIDMTPAEVTVFELASILSVHDRTHSQLSENLPDKAQVMGGQSNASKEIDVERFLGEIADYRKPQMNPSGQHSEGMFVANDRLWSEHFDPIAVHMRSSHSATDLQSSLRRYADYVKRTKGVDLSPTCMWPPFRYPSDETLKKSPLNVYAFLHTRSFHAIMYVVLLKHLVVTRRTETIDSNALSDPAMYLSVYLLTLAVLSSKTAETTTAETPPKTSNRKTVLDLHMAGWFTTDDVFANAVSRIDRVLCIDNVPGLTRAVTDGTCETFPDLARINKCINLMIPPAPIADNAMDTTSEECRALIPQSQSLTDIPYIDETSTSLVDFNAYYDHVYSLLPPTLLRPTPLPPPTPPLALPTTQSLSVEPADSDVESPMSTDEPYVEEPSGEESEGPSSAREGSQSGGYSNSSRHRHMLLRALQLGLAERQYATSRRADSPRPLPAPSQPNAALPAPRIHSVDTGHHSIISLLILAYNFASPTLYKPRKAAEQPRHGGAVEYIQYLLDLFYSRSETCRTVIDRLCPKATDIPSVGGSSNTGASSPLSTSPMDVDERAKRKKAARDRQQRLMAAFSSKQQAILKKYNMEGEEVASEHDSTTTSTTSSMAEKSLDSTQLSTQDEETALECVICSIVSPPNTENPIGYVTLVQPTSVLGQALPEDSSPWSSTQAVSPLERGRTRGTVEHNCMTAYREHLNDSPALYHYVDPCVSSSLRVSTCGHAVHASCHESYMAALKRDEEAALAAQAQMSLAILAERGEYLCPLCRQMSNSLLPLLPRHAVQGSEGLRSACDRFAQRLMQAQPDPCEVCVFNRDSILIGILRHNIELDLMMLDENLFQERLCCTPHLYRFVYTYILKKSIIDFVSLEKSPSITTLPPLLLADVSCLFIHAVASAYQLKRRTTHSSLSDSKLMVEGGNSTPTNAESPSQEHVTSNDFNVKRSFYSTLKSVQVSLQILLCHSTREQRLEFSKQSLDCKEEIGNVLRIVSKHLISMPPCAKVLNPSRSMSFDDLVSLAKSSVSKFERIADRLCVIDRSRSIIDQSKQSTNPDVVFALLKRLDEWLFISFLDYSQVLRTSLSRLQPFKQPRLVTLPVAFETIFRARHNEPCQQCNRVPRESLICLVCAQLVCFRDRCCDDRAAMMVEVEKHSRQCGAGAAVYLNVTTSAVQVMRAKRIGVWGSLYLDAYGEEDRGLRRGKPLTLSTERFALLQQQWLSDSLEPSVQRWSSIEGVLIGGAIPL